MTSMAINETSANPCPWAFMACVAVVAGICMMRYCSG